jgi:hypothetical protein
MHRGDERADLTPIARDLAAREREDREGDERLQEEAERPTR